MSEILPYNPLAQISETFSWKTAVNPCWSAEERIALRDDPSLSITYSYAIGSDEKLRDFYDFSEVNLGIPVRIPMWSSPHFHPGTVLSAASSISLTNSLLHYYLSPGDEVIIWKSATSYSPLVVNTISSSAISFTTAIGSNFSAFYILPLLTGRFNKAVNFTKGSGSRKRASLVFEVLNFVLPDPYDGYRVDKILQSIEFSTATLQDREIVSSALGIYENLPTSEVIKESWKGGFNFASPSDLVDFLILLKSLKGRAVSFTFPYSFLSPSGTSTVALSSDSVVIEHTFPRRASATIELEGIAEPPPPVLELTLLSPLTSTRGGWYGGGLNTTEIWVTDRTLSNSVEPIAKAYKINKSTGISSLISNNFSGVANDLREIKLIGNYWINQRYTFIEGFNLDYTQAFPFGYIGGIQDYVYDPVGNKHYMASSAYNGIGSRTNFIPPNLVGINNCLIASDWIYDVDYPTITNDGTVRLDKLCLLDNSVWFMSNYYDKVVRVDKEYTGSIPNIQFYGAKYNYQNLSVSVSNSKGSNICASINFIWVTQPLLGSIARIDKGTGVLTTFAVDNLLYTNEAWDSKPTYCVWLSEISRLAISCLGNNTLKLYTEDGSLTHTFSTHAKPGKAFVVDNKIYVPCMEANFIEQISFSFT